MQVLYILAGPNGAGKTTYYYTGLQESFINRHLPFINIDIIARGLGGYNAENFAKAEMIYREKVGALLKDKSDFMIESNLAKSSDYEWIERIKKHGYEIVLFFLCTDDINVNINRIHRRVKEGGHDIPPEIVMHRYRMTLIYLKTRLRLFKEIRFINTSSDEAIEIGFIKDDTLTELFSDSPKWFEEIISVEKRLRRK
jgi:predicted ABC-type ATPase